MNCYVFACFVWDFHTVVSNQCRNPAFGGSSWRLHTVNQKAVAVAEQGFSQQCGNPTLSKRTHNMNKLNQGQNPSSHKRERKGCALQRGVGSFPRGAMRSQGRTQQTDGVQLCICTFNHITAKLELS